ncbi:MAG: hypothetical protein JWQ02_729 [Capsulimonas sp.]|nr:hypothetical protein [Capsulimonas sp.]
MNFSAWFSRVTHRKPVDPSDGCSSIQPLLSLYSDKMTAPAESALVEAHLSECEDCRRALSWMQATNAVLAHREPVLPPADMSRRIRSAIADLETGKSARPVRAPLFYRPAFAAAFAILIGAVVVAQITLHHLPAGPGKAQVASQPPSIKPTVTTPVPVTPNIIIPVTPTPRPSNTQVAKRLSMEDSQSHSVAANSRPSIDNSDEAENRAKDDVLKRLKPLQEIHSSDDAHLKTPPRPIPDIHVASVPHGPTHPAAPAIKHPGNTQVAKHDVPTHETTEPPISVVPEAPQPETPSAPDPMRLATTETHPVDALSGVRVKVNLLKAASFSLPSSERTVVGDRSYRGSVDLVYLPDKIKGSDGVEH